MSIDAVLPMNINEPHISNGNQSIKKLSLFNRIAKIFSDLYQKISSPFSRKFNPIRSLEMQITELTKENKTINAFINDLYLRMNNLTPRIDALQSCAFSHGMEIQSLKQETSPRNSSFQANSLAKEIIYDTPIIKR
ncbi:MAG: hypothetical protein ACRCU0_07620 [Candidatus Rhabdochlamydia sp.]